MRLFDYLVCVVLAVLLMVATYKFYANTLAEGLRRSFDPIVNTRN